MNVLSRAVYNEYISLLYINKVCSGES